MIQIDEVGTIGERLMQLADHFHHGNKTAFGRKADIQSGVLAGIIGARGSKPGFEILQKLLTAYPTVSPIWLLFGKGAMLNEPGPQQGKNPSRATMYEWSEEANRIGRDLKERQAAVHKLNLVLLDLRNEIAAATAEINEKNSSEKKAFIQEKIDFSERMMASTRVLWDAEVANVKGLHFQLGLAYQEIAQAME